MGKFLLRFFLLLLIISVSSIIYLSYFGVETDKFDGLIKNKANEVNQNVKLGFQKTKIHLNLSELNIVVRLQNPKVLIKNNEIDLTKLDLFLSLKSFFSSDFLLKIHISKKIESLNISNSAAVVFHYINNLRKKPK